ncbi:MAG: metal ABC transporter permease [Waddliaceae bacterium]|nr:metal ABC transporter permease [Waddliaceae bacterium]
MNFIEALWSNPLLQMAVMASLAASLVSGVIGSYVVVKRIVFISGSIAHSVLGGIGISLWLQRVQGIHWLSPIHGAIVSAILSALLIGWIHLNYRQREDSVIAALWSIGMATGVLFISKTPGFNIELSNFLVGNILFVSKTDLFFLLLLDAIILLLVFAFHKQFLAICFDEEQAELEGLNVQGLYFLLLSLIAVSIVILIQIVGIVLVITMLALPATIANLFTSRLSSMMILATIIASVLCLLGMATSYHMEWPPGATIALLAGASYLAILYYKQK